MKRLLFIYGIFFIDSFAENFVELFYLKAPYFDLTVPYDQVRIWNTCAAFTKIFLYIMPLFLQRFRYLLDFDFIDRLILVSCIMFTTFDALDWIWSYNLRGSSMDWLAFLFVNIILLLWKVIRWYNSPDKPKGNSL